MAEKNIQIKIATTGGNQAAAEIGKVQSAVQDIPKGTGEAAQGVEDLNEQLAEMRERAEALKQETEEFAESQEKANNTMRLGRAALAGVGIGGAVVSKIFGEIVDGLKTLDVEKLREMDAAMADQVETAKGWAEVLTDPINGIQRLISGNTIGEAFADVNEQLALNARMQAEAIDRIIQNGRKTAEDLREVAREIAAANAILDAKDAADAKERDSKDAERIRNGEAPEDVRADRAAYDRDKKIEAINRGLEGKAANTQTLFDDARQAVINEEQVKADPRAKREDIAKAVKAAEDARKAADAAKKEYDAAAAVAGEQRRGVRTEFEATVADAGYDKSQRLSRERKKADEKAAREAAKLQAEEARAMEKARRDQERAGRGYGVSRGDYGPSEPGEVDIPRLPGFGPNGRPRLTAVEDRNSRADARARDREERGGRESGSLELKKRAEGVMSGQGRGQGDSGSEMTSLVERLVSWAEANTQGGGGGNSKVIAELRHRVEIIESKVRNQRNPATR